MTSLSFFRLMVDLEQFGSRKPDAWFMILKFSLIKNFYLTKTENRTETLKVARVVNLKLVLTDCLYNLIVLTNLCKI